jgi:predicted GIY-YIG superfamily endonuclease
MQHNAGFVKSTRLARPWYLVASEPFSKRSLARWREHTLKKSLGARTKWIANHSRD